MDTCEITADLQQQAHDHEFGDADSKGADRERMLQGERHDQSRGALREGNDAGGLDY